MSKITFQNPSRPTPFEPIQLTGDWYVRHSTRSIWDGKRNVQVQGSENAHASLPSDALAYSYQLQDDPGVKTHLEKKGWKVLGRGKDGRLESWMKETPAGIEDSAGEIRSDWRTNWIAIFFSPTLPPSPSSSSSPPPSAPPSAGIDILTDRTAELHTDTLKDIQDALDNLDRHHHHHHHSPEPSALKLNRIAHDGARDAEMQEKRDASRRKWEKRSGPEEGISPDLTYDDDDDDDKGGDHQSRCRVL